MGKPKTPSTDDVTTDPRLVPDASAGVEAGEAAAPIDVDAIVAAARPFTPEVAAELRAQILSNPPALVEERRRFAAVSPTVFRRRLVGIGEPLDLTETEHATFHGAGIVAEPWTP